MNAICDARAKLATLRTMMREGSGDADTYAGLFDAWLASLQADGPDDAKTVGQARNMYCNDDVEIDDNACLSRADNGAWVSAWVWVAIPELDDDEPEIDDGEPEHCPHCDCANPPDYERCMCCAERA